MSDVKIERYRIVENDNKKPFCVYVIEANVNGKRYVVEKRYSQFHALHVELRKIHPTPHFPPKKVRSLQQRVLEKRRQALEKYLQTMLKFQQSRTQVLSFLGINKLETNQIEPGIEKAIENAMVQQPVFQFKKDLIPQGLRTPNISDIVVDGVLLGLYKSS
ncbi:hypothetical protein RUM43_008533 [Polyplax serrata]|uniref:PX domain-containing protein n=1 Tax=Polyplax serrata TaxID=468196 RepID=A0AAN8NN66_POLSC